MTGAEFEILLLFVRSAGKVLSRDEIAEAALGRSIGLFDRSIDNHISNLRKKLGIYAGEMERIRNVRGDGLCLHTRTQQGVLMIRGIYAKIFLWFLFATGVMSGAVFLITVATHMQSLGPSWMIGVLDQYARSAVIIYEYGGKDRLAEYLQRIDDASFLQSTLLDPQGHDIVGRGVPPDAQEVLAKARATGQTQFHIGLIWTGASVDERPDGKYILVAKVIIPYPLVLGGALEATVLQWLMPALGGGLLCLLLARHIAAPIRTLQGVAGKIADGDLSVRASPALGRRRDELADLARDFDKMADRIQALLQKQQELLGDISHELRSPLTRLNVYLELIRRGKTDAVERMQADIDNLDALIGQILTLTRLQARGDRKSETAVNLRSIVESVAEDACFEGKEDGKSVTVSHSGDCWTKGDPALLRSCVENVVRNAVHYTKPQTEVFVSLSCSKPRRLTHGTNSCL